MTEGRFLDNYLRPSQPELDEEFTHPLPPIEGLVPGGKFIVQGEHLDTFSTNIIRKYRSEQSGINLVDIYKCTQNVKENVFVRLVGTMSIVKSGYPLMFLDAAVSNISPFSKQREPLTTRVLVHVPAATDQQRQQIYQSLSAVAGARSVPCKEITIPHHPDFWGPIWLAESKKLDLTLIESLRNSAGKSYVDIAESTPIDNNIDYKGVQDHMIYTASKNEHHLFEKIELTVPLEAQAAFFSMMVSGAQKPSPTE